MSGMNREWRFPGYVGIKKDCADEVSGAVSDIVTGLSEAIREGDVEGFVQMGTALAFVEGCEAPVAAYVELQEFPTDAGSNTHIMWKRLKSESMCL